MASKWILIIPSLFVLWLCVAHSLRTQGRRTTRNFFAWSFAFGFFKEFVNANSARPEYVAKGAGLTIGNVPVMVAVGWCITFYLSWYLAELLLRDTRVRKVSVLPMVALAGLITAAISLCVETAGGNAGWWEWDLARPGLWNYNTYLRMPVNIIGGWGIVCMFFLGLFVTFEFRPYRRIGPRFLAIFGVAVGLFIAVGIIASNLQARSRILAPAVLILVLLFILVPFLVQLYRDKSRNRFLMFLGHAQIVVIFICLVTIHDESRRGLVLPLLFLTLLLFHASIAIMRRRVKNKDDHREYGKKRNGFTS